MSNTLFSDIASRITRKKEMSGTEYRIAKAYKRRKEAYEKAERMQEFARKQTSPSLSRRKSPMLYDTKVKGRFRYKVYVPMSWYRKYPEILHV